MEIIINSQKFDVIESNDSIDQELLSEKLTDYFDSFDYILGDYAYGKLRLKGFNEKTNKNFKDINDYSKIHEYIDKFCAYGCKYFILKRIKKELQK